MTNYELSFWAFMAVMFRVEIFWFVTPFNVVVGYQRFGGPCCIYPLKHWYFIRGIYGVTTQKNST